MRLKVNFTGLFTLGLIGLLIWMMAWHEWQVSYWYVSLSVIALCLAVLYYEILDAYNKKGNQDKRPIIACYLSFGFSIFGVYLNRRELLVDALIFVMSIALGFTLTYVMLKFKSDEV